LGDREGEHLGVARAAKALVVYVVDDDASVRKALSRLMRSAGFEPREFECPERFLEQVCTKTPACVLLDITMPQVTGLEVQKRLKEKGIGLPVIAVSARDDEETRRLARELGAQFFLRKPVDDQALMDAIHWVMNTGFPGRSGGRNQK
jgi:FixJ family two-component response regulator